MCTLCLCISYNNAVEKIRYCSLTVDRNANVRPTPSQLGDRVSPSSVRFKPYASPILICVCTNMHKYVRLGRKIK